MATARILDQDHQLLQDLAKRTGKQQQEIIHEALETYRRDYLLDEINAAFGRLKADPKAWGDELTEREAWDDTLADGLSDGAARG